MKQNLFLEQLMGLVKLPRELGPHEIHVFNVQAKYGNYQIIIGPSDKKAKQNRSIEINGELPHLYVSAHQIRPIPSSQQVQHHLKDCIMMRNLVIHLKDPWGDGKHLEELNSRNCIHCKEQINFAGEEGIKTLQQMQQSGTLAKATYRIVQEDILDTLRGK